MSDEEKEVSENFTFMKPAAHRDSIDTMELIKESSEMSLFSGNDDSESKKDEEEDTKTLSGGSETSFVLDNKQEIDNDLESMKQNQNQSANTSVSSFSIEKKLNPLSLENGSDQYQTNHTIPEDEIDTSDLMHLEPKLRDAWIQMRKLDKKLAAVSKKERQVKRETIAFIEKSRAELELLRITSDHKESKQEAENTAHFLALSYVDLDEDLEKELKDNESELMTPVFKTQIPDLDESESSSNIKQTNLVENEFKKQRGNSIADSDNSIKKSETNSASTKSNRTKTSKTNSTTTTKTQNNSKEKEKDFIKRNIKLAQDAGGVLAMTDEEKQRLNELLLDMDNFDNDKTRSNLAQPEGESATFIVEYNPNAISLAQGDGFTPNKDEMEKLKRINTALEKRNYSRLTTSRISRMSGQLFQNSNPHVIESDLYENLLGTESKQIKLNDEFDENEFGDKFIREARLTREQENRLKFVDAQLEKLKAINYAEHLQSNQSDMASSTDMRSNSDVSLVNQEQLKQLIEEYYNENSQVILDNGNREFRKLDTLREEVDSNLESLENDLNNDSNYMPEVNENIIKKLLDDAKNEGIFDAVEANRSVSEIKTERSFFEEALEIINARQSLLKNYQESSEQTVPKDEFGKREKIEEAYDFRSEQNENLSQSEMRPSSAKSSILGESTQFYSEEKLNRSKLPPLTIKSVENYDLSREETRMSSASSISVSNTNSTQFPKINSRYLPK